ncbi:MAG TPA: MAPEG family protein [Allosphingosinicella sp.]|nr:MAPEG family protein [Allosphingosinicella sp.]
MTTELTMLAWGCVLAFLHVIIATQAKTRQYGRKWNVGPRDEDLPAPNPVVGRLTRAQDNFLETFPLMIAAVLVVSAADLRNDNTALGAMIWLGARVAYLPLYAFGVPVLRSLAWIAATVGIFMVLWPALAAAF